MIDEQSIAIIAWEKLSPRDHSLSEALGIPMIFIKGKIKYISSLFKLIHFYLSKKPRILILQLPQGLLLFLSLFLKFLFHSKVIADIHSAFLIYDSWKGWILNKPFVKLLKYVDLSIVHNIFAKYLLSSLLESKNNKITVIYDPMPAKTNVHSKNNSYLFLITTFSSDEKLDVFLEGYINSKKSYPLYISGDYKRKINIYKKYSSISTIHFLGWLNEDNYKKFLSKAKIVVTNTVREFTLQRAIWEAVAFSKAVLVPGTVTLRNFLNCYAIYYNPYDSKDISTVLNKIYVLDSDYIQGIGRSLSKYLYSLSSDSMRRLKDYLVNLLV